MLPVTRDLGIAQEQHDAVSVEILSIVREVPFEWAFSDE